MDNENIDFEVIANDKCNFDEDIDSSDNAGLLHDEYDLNKQIHEISELKKSLQQQSIECSTLIESLKQERDEYKKLNNNLQTELTHISQLKQTLQNDHDKFNEMLSKFNSLPNNTKQFAENKNELQDMVTNNFNSDFGFNNETNPYAYQAETFANPISEKIGFNFNATDTLDINDLPKWVKGCFQNDTSIQFESCANIRKILSITTDPPIQQVIDSGIIPRLIQFLQFKSNNSLQFEAAWALTNIVSGTYAQTTNVIRNGGILVFMELIQSNETSIDVKEQLIWALGNIAGDGIECRDLVINGNILNGIKSICRNYNNFSVSFLQNISWTLVNVCRPRPIPKWEVIKEIIECYNLIIDNLYLNENDDDVCENYLWAFYYLTRDINEFNENNNNLLMNGMVNSGVIERVFELLDHSAELVSKRALRVIGNIIAGTNDNDTEVILKYDLLVRLENKLSSNMKDQEKSDILWILSNIAAGTNVQIESVIKSNLFSVVMNVLNECNNYDMANEAFWTVVNAIKYGNEMQNKYLINLGVISAIFSFLKRFNQIKESKYNKLVLVVLECIKIVLSVDENSMEYIKKCDGLNVLLKSIQSSNINDNTSNKINELLNVMNETNKNIISNEEISGDNIVLKSSMVKALRYDNTQNKWRSRGKGELMVYENNTYKYIKIIFKDIKHNNKVRLLQQFNMNNNNKCRMNDEMDIEWNGNDYSIDKNEPLNSVWKLIFVDEAEKAQKFVEIFNNTASTN